MRNELPVFGSIDTAKSWKVIAGNANRMGAMVPGSVRSTVMPLRPAQPDRQGGTGRGKR